MKRIFALSLMLVFVSVFSATGSEGTVSSPGDQVVVDRSTRNKALNDYTLLTRDAIQRAWNFPLDLEVPGAVKGRISISYSINRRGGLESVKLVRSSGNQAMDLSLMQAIRSASPFPSFPDEIGAKCVLIRANFVVADLPTVTVTTVEHQKNAESSDGSAVSPVPVKKYNWGVSAGTAHKMEQNIEKMTPSGAPPARKYRWGLQQ